MKTSLKLLALLAVVAAPTAAFAQVTGAPLPASMNVESLAGVFTVALVGLTFAADYSRRGRPLTRAASRLALPRRATETHRLAA